MAIRGKMPAREHGFQFIDRAIQLPDQGANFIVIDHKHLNQYYTDFFHITFQIRVFLRIYPYIAFSMLIDIPKTQLEVFSYDWLSHGAPSPEKLEQAVKELPSNNNPDVMS